MTDAWLITLSFMLDDDLIPSILAILYCALGNVYSRLFPYRTERTFVLIALL